MNKRSCPNCKEKTNIKIRDKGVKLVFRSLMGNNRYYCLNCNATWRGRYPNYWEKMRRQNFVAAGPAAGNGYAGK